LIPCLAGEAEIQSRWRKSRSAPAFPLFARPDFTCESTIRRGSGESIFPPNRWRSCLFGSVQLSGEVRILSGFLKGAHLSRITGSQIHPVRNATKSRACGGNDAPRARKPHKAGVIKVATGGKRPTEFEGKVIEAAAIAHQQAGAPILTHTEQGDQRQPSRRRLLRVRCWLARCWKRQQPACSAIDMAAKSRSCFPPPWPEDRSTSEGIL
jgi:phosphotriesterase family protein